MKKYIALGLAALLAIGATIVPDSYDKLFLKNEGSGTSFVDSSTANPKAITPHGNATQLSLPTAFNGKRTAGFFNGTSDYVVVPASADFNFDGDFSISLFVFVSSSNNMSIIKSVSNEDWNSASANDWNLSYGGDGNVYFYVKGVGNTAGKAMSVGTWNKIVVSRSESTISLSLNDGEAATLSSSATLGNTKAVQIGKPNGNLDPNFLNGWVKNVVITKASTTVLDMKFDSPATSPLGPAIAFDGTGDYLSLADHADWDFSGDFTVETWIRWNSIGITEIFELGDFDNNKGILLAYDNLNARFDGYLNGVSQAYTSFTPIVGVWYHLAFVRSSGVAKVFINGVSLTGSHSYSSAIDSSTYGARIGRRLGTTSYMLNGSLREIRWSDSARYTSAFTPSQTGFTVDANTVLYIKGNEDNGVTTFVDSESTPKTVTTVGDTKIKYTEDYRSCIFKDETGKFPYPVGSAKVDFFSAFGSGVGYFDGTGDYLSSANNADFEFGSGNFTIETYFRSNVGTGIGNGILSKNAVGENTGWVFSILTSNYLAFGWNSANAGTNLQIAFTQLAYKYYHLAVSRSENTLYMFVNGILLGTKDVTGQTISSSSNSLKAGYSTSWTGGNVWGEDRWMNGLLDNIRISKGVARYTATFNPPEDVPQTGSKRKKASNWWFFF